jgi:hypothetical protein
MKATRIVIIDVSSSMDTPFTGGPRRRIYARLTDRDNKFGAAIEYLLYTIENLPLSSHLIIIAFANTASIIYDGGVINKEKIQGAINSLTPDGNATNIAAAFQLVIELMKQSSKALIRSLDIITDGLSNRENPVPFARELQSKFGVYIYIYLIDDTNEGYQIASDIVGEYGEGKVEPIVSRQNLLRSSKENLEQERQIVSQIAAAQSSLEQEKEICKKQASDLDRPIFTAVYPENIDRNKWYNLEIFIYLSTFLDRLKQRIEKIIKGHKKQEGLDYGQVSSRYHNSLPEGCIIQITVTSDVVEANPEQVSIKWVEKYNNLNFRIRCKSDSQQQNHARIALNIFVDNLPIAPILLSIDIMDEIKDIRKCNIDMQWIEQIFASYAREDYQYAKQIKERYQSLGIYMFIEAEDFRNLGIWGKNAIFTKIQESDIFQLFWSDLARHSIDVKNEYEKAIELTKIGIKNSGFIRPLYWEDPMVEAPPELSEIQFYKSSFDICDPHNTIMLQIMTGDFEKGFPRVLAQIWLKGDRFPTQFTANLPPFPEIAKSYSEWKKNYDRFIGHKPSINNRLSVRLEKKKIVTNQSIIDIDLLAEKIRNQLNNWLQSREFASIQNVLRDQLQPTDEVRLIIQTDDINLRKIPWHLWELVENRSKVEIALSNTTFNRKEKSKYHRNKIRILSILGDSKDININKDKEILSTLDAQVEFLDQPNRQELDAQLWSEKGWDILCFSGHSSSEMDGSNGYIYINDTEKITIPELKNALTTAIERGLQIAIFNSCDGLGLANQLASLHIPQIIVMREPVPDAVAQEFLKNFLTGFASGKSFYLAVREAREKLQSLEQYYPCASWLPVICQNPAEIPPTWDSLHRSLSS